MFLWSNLAPLAAWQVFSVLELLPFSVSIKPRAAESDLFIARAHLLRIKAQPRRNNQVGAFRKTF